MNTFRICSILAAFLLFSCNEPASNTTTDSIPGDSVPPLAKADSAAPKDSVIPDNTPAPPPPLPDMIDVTVFYNKNYCGGMKPTDEMLGELRKWRRLPNSTLKLVNKSGEFLVKTDGKGNFSGIIPAGKYNVFLTKETDAAIYDVSPDACEKCLTDVMSSVEVAHGKKSDIYVTFRCGPMDKRRQ